MARVLFLTWDGAGNQPPAAALAAALLRREHDVVFAGNEHQREYFETRGFGFVLLGRAAALWRQDAPERMFGVKRDTVWACADHMEDVPSLMADTNCEAVLVDCLMFGALAAVEKLQLRASAFVHSAPGALMPPGGPFEAQLLGPVNQIRADAGLRKLATLWEAWAPLPAVSNSIRPLDPFESSAPPSIRYCGPFREEERGQSEWESPFSAANDRPLILVSFSTGPYWDQSSRILTVLEALAGQPFRVLVTAGQAQVDPARVPPNAVVVARAPHEAILPMVALTITHAGHGTVMASLGHGVPLLCLPNPAADQPVLARQVAALGCGLALEQGAISADAVRRSAETLLHEPAYAENARRMAKIIAASPGVAFAASCLEDSLALSRSS